MDLIIDMHAHLGDILSPYGGSIIGKSRVKKRLIFDPISFSEAMLHRRFFWDDLLYRLFIKSITRAGAARSRSATLKNMHKSLKKSGVAKAVCLPVAPRCSFSDLEPYLKANPEIIAFTSPDYSNQDFCALLEGDIDQGAMGIKLHPILQEMPLTHENTRVVVQVAEKRNIPVLFHCGVHSYYPDGSGLTQQEQDN